MHENAVYSSTIRQVTSRRILAFSLLWGFSFTPLTGLVVYLANSESPPLRVGCSTLIH